MQSCFVCCAVQNKWSKWLAGCLIIVHVTCGWYADSMSPHSLVESIVLVRFTALKTNIITLVQKIKTQNRLYYPLLCVLVLKCFNVIKKPSCMSFHWAMFHLFVMQFLLCYMNVSDIPECRCHLVKRTCFFNLEVCISTLLCLAQNILMSMSNDLLNLISSIKMWHGS